MPANVTTIDFLPAEFIVDDLGGGAVRVSIDAVAQAKITGLVADLAAKQAAIQYKDEGVNQGGAGAAIIVNFTGAGITASFAGSTLTVDASAGGSGAPTDAEYVVAALHAGLSAERVITGGTGITIDNTVAGLTTVNGTVTQYTDEQAQDTVAALIQNGTGITWAYNDAGNTLTPTVTITQYTDEQAQDAVGLLVGAGLTYVDATGVISSTITQYTDELAQDSVGLILLDSATIDFTYDDATPTITAIVIDNSISNTKLRDSAAFSVIGKTAAGAGDPADIVAADETVLGRTAAGNLVFALLATGQVANDAITYAKLQNGAGFSVVGKIATGAGDNADIVAGVDSILGRSGSGNITFGTIVTNQIGASQVTYAKIQNVSATSRILGRVTAAAGVVEELTPAQARTVAGVNWSKALTVEAPTNAEDVSMFHTDEAITITKIVAVLVGSASPSVTWTLRHGTDRSAAGVETVTGGTATTSVTTGSVVTIFNDATFAANEFAWLETTAKSGTVDSINVTVYYTKD